MKQPTVLIISDDAAFSSAVTGRWKAESMQPAFTLMSSDLCANLDASTFDLAIVGGLKLNMRPLLEESFAAAQRPAVFIAEEKNTSERGAWTKILLKGKDGNSDWLEMLVLISTEILLHAQAVSAMRMLEQQCVLLERQAALGNYMLDMRHNLNNALTSIMGNSELLLMDNDPLPGGVRSQIKTIRNMSIRIHEILQRFSSLEKELTVGEEQAIAKNRGKQQVSAAKA